MGRRETTGIHKRGLMLIGVFKLFKAAALVALGFGALHYLHHDLAGQVAHLIDALRADPHNHYLIWLMEKVSKLDDHRLRQLSVGTFFYAGLFSCEGVGLLLRKRWAEYFTVIATSSFLPIEIYEIIVHPGEAKVLVLLLNVAIVAYLIWVIRTTPHHHHAKKN